MELPHPLQMNIQLRKLHLLIQHLIILQLRHTTLITQSLKEIHSGRETGLTDTGPLPGTKIVIIVFISTDFRNIGFSLKSEYHLIWCQGACELLPFQLDLMNSITVLINFPWSFRRFSNCHVSFPIFPIVKLTKIRVLL